MDIFKKTDRINKEAIHQVLKDKIILLEDYHSTDPLLEKIGDSKVVMLGEASHGTHEYYTWRAHISKRLIEEKGFDFIAVEGDWPDCYRLNRYIKGYKEAGESVNDIMKEFNRWPTWMWANWEIAAFTEWLKGRNSQLPANKRTGFYGLDVYSLWESLEAITDYLKDHDPEALEIVKEAIACFEPFKEEGTAYARQTQWVPENCMQEVVDLLGEIRKKSPVYNTDKEAVFSAEQNAHVAVNAERYYRAMIKGGPESWNLRDQHMTDTMKRLLDYHGSDSKVIVWEHNTHIGDASTTDMRETGMINIGQLAREEYGYDDVVLVGLGSYKGSVVAGSHWGAAMQEMNVPPARSGSWEDILHELEPSDLMIFTDELQKNKAFTHPLDHRAIGVVYHPGREKWGNYVPSRIPLRYNVFIFLDETRALHPLKIKPHGAQIPETYPWGI